MASNFFFFVAFSGREPQKLIQLYSQKVSSQKMSPPIGGTDHLKEVGILFSFKWLYFFCKI